MRHKFGPRGTATEKAINGIRRATRTQYSAEEKICIVLDGLRCKETITELLCQIPSISICRDLSTQQPATASLLHRPATLQPRFPL